MRSIICFHLVFLSSLSIQAQFDCDGERYRYNTVFSDVQVTYDVPYGNAINATGLSQALVADIYQPVGDTETSRPLIIMAHGGFFIGGENDNPDVISLCQDLTRMGYVVASITYRLGIDNFLDLSNAMVRSVWRGYHDGKASVRYFRKTVAEDGNPYGIDPDRILMGGVSAGAFIALHMAYVDEVSEIPEQVDQSAAGMAGGLEGESGNPGYNSDIMGVINVAGALKTSSYLSEGDEPLVSVHGTADETVPYGAGMISLNGFPITDVEGSGVIHELAESLGLNHCLTTLEGAGHVAHAYDTDAYLATLSTISGAVSSWLCQGYDPLCGAYDYTGIEATSIDGMDAFQLYPNPASQGQSIQVRKPLGTASAWSWEIWGPRGRIMASGLAAGPSAVLPTEYLPSGAYVFRIPELGRSRRLLIQ
tara:strand:- start:739 stop:2001 length:1263 start_codon:yes stop_codon:yes gene_type:complete